MEGTRIGGAAEAAVTGAWIGVVAWLVYLIGGVVGVEELRGGALLAWVLSIVAASFGLFGLRAVGPLMTLAGCAGAAIIAGSILAGPVAAAPSWLLGLAAAMIGVWLVGAGVTFRERRLAVVGTAAGCGLLLTVVGIGMDSDAVWALGTLMTVVAYPLWTVRLARLLDARTPLV
jgi:hypothetical protein